MDDSPLIDGVVRKLAVSATWWLFKTWRTRFLRLSAGGNLTWHLSKDSAAKGELKIESTCRAIEDQRLLRLHLVVGMRCLVLSFETVSELRRWKNAVNDVIRRSDALRRVRAESEWQALPLARPFRALLPPLIESRSASASTGDASAATPTAAAAPGGASPEPTMVLALDALPARPAAEERGQSREARGLNPVDVAYEAGRQHYYVSFLWALAAPLNPVDVA